VRARLRRIVTGHPLWRPARLLRQSLKSRASLPDWPSLIDPGEWEKARAAAKGGKRVLLATSIGANHSAGIVESLLAVALTLRGAEVEVLLCDSALPACMAAQLDWYPDQATFVRHGSKQDLCRVCFEPARRMVERLGLPLRRYGECIEPEETTRAESLAATVPTESIRGYEEHGIAVGEHAWAGALRFYARGDLAGEPQGEAVLRRFFAAALMAAAALRRLFATNRYDVAAFHHGIYVPQGVVRDAARRRACAW
jgi:hypothetical protein